MAEPLDDEGLLADLFPEESDPIVRAKAGDPDAWRILYAAHGHRLVAWLSTRSTGDEMAAPEDVAQQAWLVAAGKIADFEGSVDDFGGWLFTIAHKSGAGVRRRSERRRTTPADLPPDALVAPDPTLVVDTRDWLRDAIAALPARERDVVGLVDGLGYDTRTAAEVLGISAVALRVARHRGLRRLRGVVPSPGAPGPVLTGESDPALG